jgi:hypothetical protein
LDWAVEGVMQSSCGLGHMLEKYNTYLMDLPKVVKYLIFLLYCGGEGNENFKIKGHPERLVS